MAHGNLFLGQARGSIGDVVFWRGDNEQLSRARNRKPANPRTDPQLTSRILLKTVSLAYSQFMFDFANQTFQGAGNPRDNQRRFLSTNVRLMRQRISEGGTADMNFAYRDDTVALLNRYVVSEGILPSINATISTSQGASAIDFGTNFMSSGEVPTYQEICDAFGLAAGSQLTFLVVRAPRGVIEFVKRARIILSPASGDMSTAFLGDGGAINDPNPENDFNIGSFTWTRTSATVGELGLALTTEYDAVAVVASYNDGSGWKYSKQELWYNPTAGYGTHSLQVAIDSWKSETAGSDKYTQQANVPVEAEFPATFTIVSRDSPSGQPVSTEVYDANVDLVNIAAGQGYKTVTVQINNAIDDEVEVSTDGPEPDISLLSGTLTIVINSAAGGEVDDWTQGYVTVLYHGSRFSLIMRPE